ncbi:MAG: hypothetical protein JXR20_09400 [Balneola sp.]
MRKLAVGFFLVCTAFISACTPDGSNEFEEVNSWIRDNMEENYLWNERVPKKVDGSIPSGAFFGSMLDPNDYYSFITNSPDILESDLDETLYTSGVSPVFGRFSSSSGIFILAQFVYPRTSADTAGLKRGDIILAIDGQPLSTSNYQSLFYSESDSVEYTLGEYDASQNLITEIEETVTVAQREMELNPVIYNDVIEQGGKKIGYMFYSEFFEGENNKYIDSVDVVLQDMKMAGITDLIVDLRYNPGGSFSAAENLANGLVSTSAAQNEEVFVRFTYNDIIEQQIIDEEGADSERLVVNFSSDPENLGLQKIYFLVTGETSSTSELLINGLIPHMDVEIIGEETSGELFGTTMISGELATPPNTYLMVPITLKYENSEGETDLALGLQPDIEAIDDLFEAFPIGDIEDPLLGAAIQSITSGAKSVSSSSFKVYESLINLRAKKRGKILFRD